MQLPLIPQNEEHRLNALKSYQILDTLSGQEYDDITQIASQLCETPISLITLLDEKRQWFKSKHGLDVSETPREIAFCSHAINEPDNIFEVEDALEDNRFYDNPLVVGNPNIRFYAGAPLITSNGEALGTLCVIDTKPRKLTTIQRKTLLNLAKQVMAQLELRKKNKELSVLLQKTKALKEKFENLSLVVSKTHVGVIITNAKGEIEHTNAAFGALSGYRIEEVIGETPGSFLYGKDTNLRHIQKMQEGLKSQQPFDQEILNYKKTGEPYWSSCSISPVFDDDGALISYVAVEQDITAQKENEAALIQAKEEAIAGVLVKDQFLSNMSHEIRTPMNGIIGISNILLKDADFTEKSRELIVHLNGAAHHLLTIINDILDLSKINAEKLTFERINFDFHKIFETLHYSLGLKAKEGGIDFVIKIDPEIPLILSGDPTRFNQILLNLTSNAIKFTERGKVEVSARLLEINEEGPKIIFKVIDTGIGIGKDKIGEVFEQFTQSNLTISRKYGGTGLGLCISKRLIEMHKGRIKVESELGKGSVFTFDLQLYNEISEVDTTETTFVDMTSEEKAKIRILLAEDNKLNQIVAKKHINDFGFSIEIAENGQEAIDMLRVNDYDLILMDVNMPVLNGLEATRYIRQHLIEKKDIKIAAMTAWVLPKDIQLCFDAGMDSFISKPFVSEELYQKIVGMLSS